MDCWIVYQGVNTLKKSLDYIVIKWKFDKLEDMRNEKINHICLQSLCEGCVTCFAPLRSSRSSSYINQLSQWWW